MKLNIEVGMVSVNFVFDQMNGLRILIDVIE